MNFSHFIAQGKNYDEFELEYLSITFKKKLLNTKKVVITGGPGTGKSSIINELKKRGHTCFEEISRQIILNARQEGIDQLFITNPLLFSELLLKGRIDQFTESNNSQTEFVFLDRGIPDIIAYMNYIGDTYPENFVVSCKENVYDHVFILEPWQEIYKKDNERYESFEQAVNIHHKLLDTYHKFDYDMFNVPFANIEERANHIINTLKTI